MFQGGNDLRRLGERQLELSPILLEFDELLLGGQIRHRERLAPRLERSDEQFTGLLLDIDVAIRVAEHRQRRHDPVEGLGHHVHVFARIKRHADAQLGRQVAGPQPAAENQRFALDGAVLRFDAIVARRPPFQPRHRAVLEDPRAALFGASDQRHHRIDRVELAVLDDIERTLDPGFVDGGIEGFRLPRPDDFRLDTEALGDGGGSLDLIQAVRVPRDGEGSVLFEAGRLAGLGFEAGIELHVVTGQFGQAMAGAKLHDQSGSVPRCAAGQRTALEDNYVGKAELGQMVGDTASGDAAADDNDAGVGGGNVAHMTTSRKVRSGTLSRVDLPPRFASLTRLVCAGYV